MTQYIIKVIITAVVVVAISESAKRSIFFAGLIASLPLTSILAMVWLYTDSSDIEQVSNLSKSIFWMVLPSLGFFLAFPLFTKWGFSFPVALAGSIISLILSYAVYVSALSKIGVQL